MINLVLQFYLKGLLISFLVVGLLSLLYGFIYWIRNHHKSRMSGAIVYLTLFWWIF